MKKIIFLLVVAAFLAGCGGNSDNVDNNEDNNNAVINNNGKENTNDQIDNQGSIEVEENLFSVEVTIPASFIGDEDLEQIQAEAEQEDGIKEVTINDDQSMTYKMSKSAHNEMMNEMAEGLDETIEETKNNEDFPSIVNVTANRSYTEFTMTVEREAYENSFDGFAAFSLGLSSMFYQLFDGVESDSLNAIINIEDTNTGEVFHTIVYPDDLD